MIYEIFPDRFSVGLASDVQTKLRQPAYQRTGYKLHAGWHEEPLDGSDFFGGDLRGVIDRIDYLQDLGVEALYLTPLFTAYSNHKYDTVDFDTIDPMFGDDRLVETLIDKLHRQGIRLILDAVLNHVGANHAWFQAALRNERPYRDFFTFLPEAKYLCWWGYDSLPELRVEMPALARRLYRGPDSLLQRWLNRGIDGWRFDTALDLGVGVAAEIREAVAGPFPHAELIGEVLSFGSDYCAGSQPFHGIMNYWFRYATLGWMQETISTRAYYRAVQDYYSRFGHEAALRSWNILSTHDTPRLKSELQTFAAQKLALVLQFTLPGTPLVYYGEENGMTGGADPQNRRPMQWDESMWDPEVRSFYKRLIHLRQTRRELKEGKLLLLNDYTEGDALAYVRYGHAPNEESLVVVNKRKQRLQQRLLVPHTFFEPRLWFKDLLGNGSPLQFLSTSMQIDLPPESAAIYVPDDGYILPNDSQGNTYAYFKPRILGENL